MAAQSRKDPGGGCIHALTAELPWHRGEAALSGDVRCPFEVLESRGGVSHVRFQPEGPAAGLEPAVRSWLKRAGSPVVGGSGESVRGQSTLFVGEPDAVPPTWPAPFAADASSRDLEKGRLSISGATARALRAGHPWVIGDEETGSIARHAPGAIVRLADPGGRLHGLARVDDAAAVVARIWDPKAQHPRDAPSIEARVARALEKRAAVAAAQGPDGAWRAIHGEADGLPGLHVDVLGGTLRLVLGARCALPLRERVVAALASRLAPRFVVEVIHLRHAPPGRLECVRLDPVFGSAGAGPADGITIREAELSFRIDLGLSQWDRPRPGVGFFLDQRVARAELRRRTREGGAYLNLFAHTGAFSAVMLAAGAAAVTSVDLSGPYLEWLDANLEASGLDGRGHSSVQRDVRRFLIESEPASFDGVVLDPPTAAAAGRRFLATRRELSELIQAALRVLRPGGWLYVSRNDRKGRGRLGQTLREAAESAGWGGVSMTEGRLPDDFPVRRGFPEGDPFEAYWLRMQNGEGKRTRS